MKWSPERNTLFGFALALLLVVFLSVLAHRNTQQFIETNDWVEHSLQVLEELEGTRALVSDAETGQRGYILTGDENYLQPYYDAETSINERLDSLQTLFNDNSEQLTRLESLRLAIEQRFDRFETTITIAREEGLEAARQAVLSGVGKVLMDQIRREIDEISQIERQLLETRREDVESTAQTAVLTIGLLTVIVILVLVLVYWFIDRNVNRLRQSQATLKLSEERWRSLVENMPDVITTFDVDGTLNYVNHQNYGPIRREHVIGKKIHDLVHPDQRETMRYLMEQVIESRKPLSTEFTSGQSGRHMLSTFAPVIVDNQIVNVIGSSVDISERKRAEEKLKRLNNELQAANKELEAFSYSVSHDLRAPLRSIDGFSLALLEDCEEQLDDVGKSYLRRIRAATQRMGQLIDDLLTLSRVTRSEMNWDTVNLTEVARKVVQQLKEANPARKVEVIIQDGLQARGDGNLLRVVLVNLLENSWKFTGKKSEARIEVGTAEQDGEQVFFVRDDGAGFDMTYAHKLFGAFQRLHADEDFKGTGIGLATVQRIIHRHGGRVWAEGHTGQGATFYFTLPTRQSEPTPQGG